MADWRARDQAAGLRRLFGAEMGPLVAFAAGPGLPGRAGFVLRTGRRLAAMGHSVVILDELGGDEGLAAGLRLNSEIDLIDVLAGDARTARPVPDLAKLAAAPPISAMPGFLGFD